MKFLGIEITIERVNDEKPECGTCHYRPDDCCVRYAPVVVDTESVGYTKTVWPRVHYQHWCGEYVRREDKR